MQANTTTTAKMKIFTFEVQTWGLDENNKFFTASTETVEVIAENVWQASGMVKGDSKNCLGSREIVDEPQPTTTTTEEFQVIDKNGNTRTITREAKSSTGRAEELFAAAIAADNITETAKRFFWFDDKMSFKMGAYETLQLEDANNRVCCLSTATKGIDLWLKLPMSGKEGFLGELAEVVNCDTHESDIKYLLYYATEQAEYETTIIQNYTNED
jgi:hypothetical protein